MEFLAFPPPIVFWGSETRGGGVGAKKGEGKEFYWSRNSPDTTIVKTLGIRIILWYFMQLYFIDPPHESSQITIFIYRAWLGVRKTQFGGCLTSNSAYAPGCIIIGNLRTYGSAKVFSDKNSDLVNYFQLSRDSFWVSSGILVFSENFRFFFGGN